MTEDDKERYEWGELEREAERSAQFAVVGGFWHTLFMWFARKFRKYREEVERDMGLRK